MITDPLQVSVVEYSLTQNATNVETLNDVIVRNLNNLGRKTPCDYLPIGLFEKHDQAVDFCNHFREAVDDTTLCLATLIDLVKLFAVEYSIIQDETRVRTLKNAVRYNLTNLGKREACDFVPIALFESRNQADDFCLRFRQGIDWLNGDFTEVDWSQIRDLAVELLPRRLSPFVLREVR